MAHSLKLSTLFQMLTDLAEDDPIIREAALEMSLSLPLMQVF